MKLLFTCVGRRVELVQQFLSAAKKENITLEIHGADSSNTAPALFFCHKGHTVPRISDGEYLPTLLRICREERIDLVIPTIDTDLIILAENRHRFEALGTRVMVSDAAMIKQCRNKLLTNRLFLDAGLSAPASCDDIRRYDAGFPAFIRPVDGSSSINAFYVEDPEKLRMLAKEIGNYIIQPYIDGEEYTVDVFCDFSGEPIYITPRKRLAMRSGEVIKTEISQDQTIIDEVKQLVEYIRPYGAVTVQLLREKSTGVDWYIEINPRFGGGAPLSIDAGADAASALLQILSGKPVTYHEFAAEDGALYLRFDQSIKINTKKGRSQ